MKTKNENSKLPDQLKKLREELGFQPLFNGKIAPEIKIEINPPFDKFNFDKIRFELEMTKKENCFLKYTNEVFKLRNQENVDEILNLRNLFKKVDEE